MRLLPTDASMKPRPRFVNPGRLIGRVSSPRFFRSRSHSKDNRYFSQRPILSSAGAHRWLWRVPGAEVMSRSAPARATAGARRGTDVARNRCHRTELDGTNGSANASQSLTVRAFAALDGTGRNERARIRLPLALPKLPWLGHGFRLAEYPILRRSVIAKCAIRFSRRYHHAPIAIHALPNRCLRAVSERYFKAARCLSRMAAASEATLVDSARLRRNREEVVASCFDQARVTLSMASIANCIQRIAPVLIVTSAARPVEAERSHPDAAQPVPVLQW